VNRFDFGNSSEHDAWLAEVREDVIDPALPIIDAHHHLWVRNDTPYLLPEFAADLATGHNIVATVFAECHSMYRQSGPSDFMPVGESEFVGGIAAMSDSGTFGTTQACKVMFGSVDMELGLAIEPVLDAHVAASGGRFRGVRVSACWHESDKLHRVVDDPDYLSRSKVREAMGVLERRGLSMDVWIYHTQLDRLIAIAEDHPALTIVLDHCGTPILGGPYRGREKDVLADWQAKIGRLAQFENVYMKAGALPIRAAARERPDLPPSSVDIAAEWEPWVEASIDSFGPGRCMFESNFPVHKNWCSYPILWNAYKRLASGASEEDKTELFFGTANRAYRMNL
jgi:predicted TIM-barrel fold metal-dependent hydrolase